MKRVRKWLTVMMVGIGVAKTVGAAERLEVVTTVGMVTDLVRQVAGDRARVEGLIGEGVDPHLYKSTRGDLVALKRAQVVIINGLQLEGKMGAILEGEAARGKPVLALAEAIVGSGGYSGKVSEEGVDPHLWMDVAAWRLGVDEVADFLVQVDPAGEAEYRANAAAYREELGRLDAWARAVLGSIPEGQRLLVTAHDAFGYFGRAYGLEVRGIQGLSTESEAGIRDLEELLRTVVERRVPAIFVESTISDKNVRALVEGAAARGHALRIGGTLYSDAMGPAGTPAGTYVGMLEHNVRTIVEALGGRLAEGEQYADKR